MHMLNSNVDMIGACIVTRLVLVSYWILPEEENGVAWIAITRLYGSGGLRSFRLDSAEGSSPNSQTKLHSICFSVDLQYEYMSDFQLQLRTYLHSYQTNCTAQSLYAHTRGKHGTLDKTHLYEGPTEIKGPSPCPQPHQAINNTLKKPLHATAHSVPLISHRTFIHIHNLLYCLIQPPPRPYTYFLPHPHKKIQHTNYNHNPT